MGWPRVPHGGDLSSLVTVSCVTRAGAGAGTRLPSGSPHWRGRSEASGGPVTSPSRPCPQREACGPVSLPSASCCLAWEPREGPGALGTELLPVAFTARRGRGVLAASLADRGRIPAGVCGAHSLQPRPLIQPAASSHCLPRAWGRAASPRSQVTRHVESRTRCGGGQGRVEARVQRLEGLI